MGKPPGSIACMRKQPYNKMYSNINWRDILKCCIQCRQDTKDTMTKVHVQRQTQNNVMPKCLSKILSLYKLYKNVKFSGIKACIGTITTSILIN